MGRQPKVRYHGGDAEKRRPKSRETPRGDPRPNINFEATMAKTKTIGESGRNSIRNLG